MEVLSLADASRNNDPLRTTVGRLIETVGTPKFESEIFDAARHAVNCEHISAFVSGDAATPRALISATANSLSIPHDVAEKYFARYWNLDPVNRAVQGTRDNSFALRIVPEKDIEDAHYRNECYTAYRLVDRLSIVRRNGEKTYRINFYGGGRYGKFADSDVSHILNSADIVMSLLIKHDSAPIETTDERTAEMYRKKLRLVSPKMPSREAEVCTAIMLGMTSEAIAIELGISVNTVLTYRKRAYGRLKISCQNELMRLILC
jgi:DNA-binding CsgD family transcriptional regulator